MKIQRYDMDYGHNGDTVVFESTEGDWVDYDDHKAKMDQAMRIIEKFRELLKRVNPEMKKQEISVLYRKITKELY